MNPQFNVSIYDSVVSTQKAKENFSNALESYSVFSSPPRSFSVLSFSSFTSLESSPILLTFSKTPESSNILSSLSFLLVACYSTPVNPSVLFFIDLLLLFSTTLFHPDLSSDHLFFHPSSSHTPWFVTCPLVKHLTSLLLPLTALILLFSFSQLWKPWCYLSFFPPFLFLQLPSLPFALQSSPALLSTLYSSLSCLSPPPLLTSLSILSSPDSCKSRPLLSRITFWWGFIDYSDHLPPEWGYSSLSLSLTPLCLSICVHGSLWDFNKVMSHPDISTRKNVSAIYYQFCEEDFWDVASGYWALPVSKSSSV